MADCFDVARLIVDRTEGSTIFQAALAGVAAALVEVGGQGRWTQREADVQRQGLLRVAALAASSRSTAARGRTCPCSRTRPTYSATGTASGSPRWRSGPPSTRARVSAGERTRSETMSGKSYLPPPVLSYGLSSLAAAPGDLLASIARPLAGD